jgi:hypothetical protein
MMIAEEFGQFIAYAVTPHGKHPSFTIIDDVIDRQMDSQS